MMSPMMKMTTKSSTVIMSSVIGYCYCMRNYVIFIIEIIIRICKGILRAKFDNVAYICGNCFFFRKLLRNKSLNIYNYQVKLLRLHVVAYICYNCYFFMLLRNNSFNIHNYL